MATQPVRVYHVVQLKIPSGAFVTVVVRDHSFDLLLQSELSVILGGSYCLKAKLPFGDSSKALANATSSASANTDKNEDGFVYLPVTSGSFESDFDNSGINVEELPAFDRTVPVFLLRFSTTSTATASDVEFCLDDVKHENDLVTLNFSETYRSWQPAVSRTSPINMSVTRLASADAQVDAENEQVELVYSKRIQIEPAPTVVSVSRTMRIVTTPSSMTSTVSTYSTSAVRSSLPNQQKTPPRLARISTQSFERREAPLPLKRSDETVGSTDASIDRSTKQRRLVLTAASSQMVNQPSNNVLTFSCHHCNCKCASEFLLQKHIKVVHLLICPICSKKSPTVAQSRDHNRICEAQLNKANPHRVVARSVNAAERDGTSLPAANQTGVARKSQAVAKTGTNGKQSGVTSVNNSAKTIRVVPGAAIATTSIDAKADTTSCAICKRVCKTVPGLKSHIQQAHRNVYLAVLLAIYRRCSVAQHKYSVNRKQPAFKIASDSFYYDPQSDELRAAIGAFFDELEAEKERASLIEFARQLTENQSFFNSVAKTIEDRGSPCSESRRAIWNFFDVERLTRAIERMDAETIDEITKRHTTGSNTLSNIFDILTSTDDATTRPKETSTNDLSVVEDQSDDNEKEDEEDDSSDDLDDSEMPAAGAEVSRLVKEGPSGYLARCDYVPNGRIRCAECHKEYQNEQAILKHRLRVHIAKLRFRCTICDHASCDRHALEQHMFTHAKDGEAFDCAECGAVFESRPKLSSHWADTQHRPTNDESNALHRCVFSSCGLMFKSRTFLENHFSRCHAGEPLPPSPVPPPPSQTAGDRPVGAAPQKKTSSEKTAASSKAKQHQAASSSKKTVNKMEDVLYRCSVCAQLFADRQSILNHQEELLQSQTRYAELGDDVTEPHTLANSSAGAPTSVNPLTNHDLQYLCGLCDVVFTCECYAHQHVRLMHPENEAQASDVQDTEATYGTANSTSLLAVEDDTDEGAEDDALLAGGDNAAALYTIDNASNSHEIGL